jgi:hypothetical protein
MLAIPRNQYFYALFRAHSNVQCILIRYARERASIEQGIGELRSVVCESSKRQWREEFQPFGSKYWVAASRLLDGNNRATERKLRIGALPPILCEFLMRSGNQITAGFGDEIADDRGFDVDALFHFDILPRLMRGETLEIPAAQNGHFLGDISWKTLVLHRRY